MNNKTIFLMLLCIFVTACSPAGNNSGHIEVADLTGLWNSSENIGADTDVMYTRISSDGGILEYDYDGDQVDKGLNCYQINSGSIVHIAKNYFLVTADMHKNKQFEIELELLDNGYALKIYFLDTTDSTKTIKSQIWTRESDSSLLDSEPPCSEVP